jgi:hypothetical protein
LLPQTRRNSEHETRDGKVEISSNATNTQQQGKRAPHNQAYLLRLRHGGIDAAFTLFQKVLQEAIVQELGSFCLREHCPQQKGKLKGVVERNPVEKKVPEGFDKGKESKNDPIDEPLNIVPLGFGFDRLERLERRVHESHDGTKHTSTNPKEDQQGEDCPTTENKVLLGNLCGGLQ